MCEESDRAQPIFRGNKPGWARYRFLAQQESSDLSFFVTIAD
jgi:hypothetical protein